MNQKRILIVHPSGYVSISPTIISIIQYLTQKGAIVHVVAVFGEKVDTLPFQSHYFIQKKNYLQFPPFIRLILNALLYTLYPFLLFIILFRYSFSNAFLIDAIGLFYSLFLPYSLRRIYVVLHIKYLSELMS